MGWDYIFPLFIGITERFFLDWVHTQKTDYDIMNKFIFVLSTIFIIISCSGNPTGPGQEFEPYRVGNWLVTAPNTVEYIGESKSKFKAAQGDTIDIKQPGDRSLKLWQDTSLHRDRQFVMEFVDSTANQDDRTQHGIKQPSLEFPTAHGMTYPINSNGYTLDYSPDYIKSRFAMNTNCNHGDFDSNKPVILVKYEKEDGGIFRAYRIHVDGILQAVKDIACG